MRKCGFCTQRIDRGNKPGCVAKCTTGALAYFPDARRAGAAGAYGKNERLHMIYELAGAPKEYSLPDPAPGNTMTSAQIWNWLIGLIPGGVLIGWMLKKAGDRDKEA